MKRFAVALGLVIVMAVTMAGFAGIALAEETKFVGVITKIELSGKEAKTATVVLKDNKTEEPVTVIVNDDLTLDKLKDHRIVEGDEIRCKYDVVDGKNISKTFKKTAGC